MSIAIPGMDKLIRKLGAAKAIKTYEPPMQRGVLRLQAYMQVYPPAPAHSRYIRGYGFPHRPTSEKYGQRWTTKVESSSSGLVGRVGNNASYGPWVGSDRFQTLFHAHTGWHTDAGAVKQNEGAILADFQAAADRALAS